MQNFINLLWKHNLWFIWKKCVKKFLNEEYKLIFIENWLVSIEKDCLFDEERLEQLTYDKCLINDKISVKSERFLSEWDKMYGEKATNSGQFYFCKNSSTFFVKGKMIKKCLKH